MVVADDVAVDDAAPASAAVATGRLPSPNWRCSRSGNAGTARRFDGATHDEAAVPAAGRSAGEAGAAADGADMNVGYFAAGAEARARADSGTNEPLVSCGGASAKGDARHAPPERGEEAVTHRRAMGQAMG